MPKTIVTATKAQKSENKKRNIKDISNDTTQIEIKENKKRSSSRAAKSKKESKSSSDEMVPINAQNFAEEEDDIS